MAIEGTLTSVCLRTGALLLLLLTTMMMMVPRAKATNTGSDEGRGTSADEGQHQVQNATYGFTNGSLSTKPTHPPIYLNPGIHKYDINFKKGQPSVSGVSEVICIGSAYEDRRPVLSRDVSHSHLQGKVVQSL